jgi:hypothetical protein
MVVFSHQAKVEETHNNNKLNKMQFGGQRAVQGCGV